MKYNHDSMLPIGAFKPRGSVVGGRSMRLHGGDSYMPSDEERFGGPGSWQGGGDSGAYWVPEQPTPQQAAADVAQIYEEVLGRAPDAGSSGWVEAITSGSRTPEQIRAEIIASPEASQNAGIPAYNSSGDATERFTSGAVALEQSGYVPNKDYTYEGVPTVWTNPQTGKSVFFGNAGTGGDRSNITEKYQWWSPEQLAKLGPDSVPVLAHENPDKYGWLGNGQWKAPVAMALAFAAPQLMPYLSAALGGGIAGSIGSGALYGGLSGGITGGAKGALQGGILGGLGGAFGGALQPDAAVSGSQFVGDIGATGGEMSFGDLVNSVGLGQNYNTDDVVNALSGYFSQTPTASGFTPEMMNVLNDIASAGGAGFDIYNAVKDIPDAELYNTLGNLFTSSRPPSGGAPEQPSEGGSIPGFNQPVFVPGIGIVNPSGYGGVGGAGGAGGGGGGGIGGGGFGGSDSSGDTEEEKQRKREQAAGLMAQTQTVLVKPPPVAEIDYMYDIGGESIFATPKQETLMPSPFEETPEAVEGAMPRYQYYDPQGGYQYAEGGMVAFDEGGNVTQEELEAAARPLTYNPKLAAYGERRRETTPPKEMSETDLLIAELAAGFHPVIGPALSAKDFEEAREENNYLGMGLAGLGMIPVVGGAIKGYNRLVKPALRNRAIEKELVENWGKIPKGQPIPEGYIGGPSELPRLPSAKSQSGYYEQPKFQTDYGREFTHDLVHSSPSPNIASFDPTLSGSEHSVRSATLNPSNTRGGSFPNPLLAGTHPADDITTFLSNDAAYSSQYMPRDYVYPTPKTEGKIFPNYSYPRVAGMPKVQKVYDPGATMYPVSARLGKVFDPTAPGADKIAEEFLGTIKMPKGMDEKTFNSYLDSARYSILKGDSKSVESAPFREFLKNEGFDSFAILKGAGDDQVKNYGVFDPSRIRGKYAEFNPEQAASADIMKAEGGFIDDYTIDDLYEILRGK